MGKPSGESVHVVLDRPRGPARPALWVIGLLALLVGLLQLLTLLWPIVGYRARGSVVINGLGLGNPGVVSFIDRMSNATGHYETVSIEVADPPRALLDAIAWHDAASALPAVLICALVCGISWSALQGRPFARLAPLLLGLTGVAFLVADLVSEWFFMRVQREVVRAVGAQATAGDVGNGPQEGLSTGAAFTMDHLGLALFLVVLAVVFSLGLRMQRDTEALV